MTLVAIHQPNFFPWLGYFDKIRRADIFVFLDGVDYPRSGSGGMGSWCNRVRINVGGAPHWLTAPVKRMALGQPISAARIDDSKPWRRKALKTLRGAYAKAPNCDAALEFLSPLLLRETDNLADYNMANIQAIATRLGLQTCFVRESDLSLDGTATERLINIVTALGGTGYLSGGGAGDYQQEDLYARAGIDLVMQGFEQRPYRPAADFLPGLSIIDYLMHDIAALNNAPERSS